MVCGSTVPALGSDSRSNIQSLIYQLVIGSQAYRHNHSVGWTIGVAQSLSSWVVVQYQQQGRSGGSIMPATGLYSIGKSTQNLVGRSQAYQHNQYHNSRHSGAIGLLMVCGSTVPVQGQFRRQISTEFCRFRFIYILA